MLNILSILITVVKVATPAAETGFFAGLLAGLMVPWVLYLLTFLGIIALIYTHETKEIGWSHTLFILITAYLCFYFKVSWRDLIYNPIPLLKWVGIYLLFGTGWSFFKWYFYLKNLLSEFNEKKEAIKKDLSNDARFKDDKLFKSEMYDRLYNYYNYRSPIRIQKIHSASEYIEIKSDSGKKEDYTIYQYEIINPQANQNKALITTWITHWPVSLVWTLINDPIKKFINYIFSLIQSFFQKVSDSIFASVKSDL